MRTLLVAMALLLGHQGAIAQMDRRALFEASKEFITHAQYLNQMLGTVPVSEREIVQALHRVAMVHATETSFIGELVGIRDAMRNTEDRTTVQTSLDKYKNRFGMQCRENVRHLNAQLGFSGSPAVVSEGTRLRETLVKICSRVEQALT